MPPGADRYPEVADRERRRFLTEVARENCATGWQLRAGDAANFAIGQGDVLATPLQMAVLYGAIADGGTVRTPRVGAALVDPVSGERTALDPGPTHRAPLSAATDRYLRSALRRVVTSGTAAAAFAGMPADWPVAGKTGTGEVVGKRDTSWFVSYAPATRPRWVVAAVVAQGGPGGSTAAPVTARCTSPCAGWAERHEPQRPDRLTGMLTSTSWCSVLVWWYVAAIRASQLGKKVAVVEKKYWGGVCLNVGCIPSKALIKNAELAHTLQHEKELYGIEGEATMKYGATHARSRKVSAGIVKGVHFLMKKNKIEEVDGWGTLTSATSMDVALNDGSTRQLTFDHLIIAAGAVTRMLPGVEVSQNVVTYEEQILDENLPGSIVIAGSGAIGVEFAYVMKNFGVDVTIVEFLDRMVPTEDEEISKELLKHYKKLGVKVMLSTKVEGVEDTGSGVRVTVSPAAGGDQQVLEADKFMSAIGFAPRTEGYGLEATGVQLTERGAIAIDEYGRTNVENVYAIGDCTAKLMLAHVAEAQGVVAAEHLSGAETMPVEYDFIPRATYCHPQIGSFGYSEAQAKEKGYDVKTAKFPFSANGKAMGLGDAVGFVKVVADAEHNEIIGAHMIGPDVTELLPVLTLAQKWDLTADEVSRNVFAHPTLSEAVKEAVEGIAGHMINL